MGIGGGGTFSGEKREAGAVTTRWRDDGVGRDDDADIPEMIGAEARRGEGEKTVGGFGGGAGGGGEDALFTAASVAAVSFP